MPLEPRTLSLLVIVLAAVVVALLIWVSLLQRDLSALRRRLRRVFAGGEEQGLDEILDGLIKRLDRDGERLGALSSLHRELEAVVRGSIQRVGMVRFNPFPDTGGDQSFAIALLDADGTGIVISSLHSRGDTRVFAKPVAEGRSRHALSDEEQDAIRRALAPSERQV